MKSTTLSIMFVDVQGYTSRTSGQTRHENQTFIEEVRNFVEKHVSDKGGKMVKAMGDGFMSTFESPTDAVVCGLEMQKEIERRNANILDTENFVRFRIGICTGEVNLDKQGDVYGDAVNIAARIEKFTEPNEVFISEATYLAMNKSEVKALDLGPQKFKNVLEEIRVYKILKDDLHAKSLKSNKVLLVKGLLNKLIPKKYQKIAAIVASILALIIIIIIFGSKKTLPEKPTILLPISQKPAKPQKDIAKELSEIKKEITQIRKESTPAKPVAVRVPKTTKEKKAQLKAMQPIEEVKKMFDQKRYEDASILAEQYLKGDPDNFALLELIGRSSIELGDLKSAQKYLERAIKVSPDTPVVYRELALIYEGLKNYDEAIKMLKVYALKEKLEVPRKKALDKIKALKERKAEIEKQKALRKAERKRLQEEVTRLEREEDDRAKKEEAKKAEPKPVSLMSLPGPVGELQPVSMGRFDTSKMDPKLRSCCVDYLIEQADLIKTSDPNGSKYLNDQAQKVRLGQMIEVECKCPSLQ